MKKCPKCDGEGKVCHWYAMDENKTITCPDCGGVGKILGMPAFKKWKSGHDQKLADDLNKDKRGFELGLELGWRGALEMVLKGPLAEGVLNPDYARGRIIEELESGE